MRGAFKPLYTLSSKQRTWS